MKRKARVDTVISTLLLTCFLLPWTGSVLGSQADREIEYLLTSVGTSQCQFTRNGTSHPADDAESHLRMKYRKGKRYVKTAEHFIDRIASASSITRRPYLMRCTDGVDIPAGEWLHRQLESYRNQALTEKSP